MILRILPNRVQPDIFHPAVRCFDLAGFSRYPHYDHLAYSSFTGYRLSTLPNPTKMTGKSD